MLIGLLLNDNSIHLGGVEVAASPPSEVPILQQKIDEESFGH